MKKMNRLVTTILSIILGLLVGGILLLIAGYNPLQAYGIIFEGIFGSGKDISYVITRSTPIILTGLSVAFAFKTGLFNIGAEGQFIIGSLFATIAGYKLNLPPIIHPIVAMAIGAMAGAIWAGIAGFLKARRGINEVITSIMLNWIALHLNNYFLTFTFFRKPNSDASYKILDSASIRILQTWKRSEGGRAFLSTKPFLQDFFKAPVNFGFIIAVILAILIWYILKNTTLGYELKAVGYNKDAAEYGGIDIKKNILRSMMIAGAISGLAGAIQVLGVSSQVSILAATEGYGFDGMAVSLIAGNNPIAVIASGLLFGGLNYGGAKLNSSVLQAPSEIISIIVGIIVFFVAMPKLFQVIANKLNKKRGVE